MFSIKRLIGRRFDSAEVKKDKELVPFKIIEGDNGLFIAMPSRQTATGGYRDIAHPINSETRQVFEKEIIEAYENAESE